MKTVWFWLFGQCWAWCRVEYGLYRCQLSHTEHEADPELMHRHGQLWWTDHQS